MKELSIEEKAKRYDEALEKSKRLYEQGTITESLCYVFPELKESEDEKVRKGLLKMFNHYVRNNIELNEYDLDKDMVLAWLEKQGEQKPADKVEPKFKVGDWVIDKQGLTHKISRVVENVSKHTFGYDIVGGGYFNDNTEGVRLWTIQDAKDGDVLAYRGEQWIFIYKERKDETLIEYYALASERRLTINAVALTLLLSCIVPATKEQRDTLEKAITNAGYRWDKEKLKLEKV